MGKSSQAFGMAAAYIGAIIGAGFASGQEILYFFAIYGRSGLVGALMAGAGLAFLGGLIFKIANKERFSSYHQLLKHILGVRLGKITDFWLSVYLFGSLVIMLAGCGAVFREQLGLPAAVGITISLLGILIALSFGEQGLVTVNSVLVPLIITGALLVAALNILPGNTAGNGESPLLFRNNGWAMSALLYISYNLAGGLVLLVNLSGSYGKPGLIGTVIGGLSLGVLALTMTGVLVGNYPVIQNLEVPMLFLARQTGWSLGYAYALVLWFAMLTTAVVNTSGLKNRFREIARIPEQWLVTMILMAAVSFTSLGFSQLVRSIYPFFGYLGLVIIIGIFRVVLRS